MCWKKIVNWWNNLQENNPEPPPPNPEFGIMKKIAILFAINNYPGSQNDLQGCLNDQKRVSYKLPDFEKRLFKDSQVTIENFEAEILKASAETSAGDNVVIHYSGHGTYIPDTNDDEVDGKEECLYLYNGVLTGDRFGELLDTFKTGVKVRVFLDSCFSESATRALNLMPNSDRGRFRIFAKFSTTKKYKRKKFIKPINWVVYSGCSEHQTSADAFLDGTFNGAFTYYLWECMDRKYTDKQWFAELKKVLPSSEYNQIPTLEGPEELINSQIFT
jgi:metacaspase-1